MNREESLEKLLENIVKQKAMLLKEYHKVSKFAVKHGYKQNLSFVKKYNQLNYDSYQYAGMFIPEMEWEKDKRGEYESDQNNPSL